MEQLEGLVPGLTGKVEIVVGEEHTAPHVGSGQVHVLATPVLVNLLEAAALQAAESYVPAGHQTVGIHLDVEHFAATPVGMRVTARAEVIEVKGRKISFKLSAEDEVETIGGGTHERVIINLERFDVRMQDKIKKHVPSVKR
ncbi:MAG TPA: thioesterase family protein [Burkholderiales bacterium]